MMPWLPEDVRFVQSEGLPIQVQSRSQGAVPDGPAYLSVSAYEEAGDSNRGCVVKGGSADYKTWGRVLSYLSDEK
jgi:hypothetical protein